MSVSRAPMPSNEIECVLCRDTGLQYRDGEFFVCMSPLHAHMRPQQEQLCKESNETLAKLNRKTAAKR
jgi:hypothetical protein